MNETSLLHTWTKLWYEIDAKGDDYKYYKELGKLYLEPPRAYHNFKHIEECLEYFGNVKDLSEYPDEVEFAIFFHDAIYDPRKKDNEEKSANLAYKISKKIGQSEEFSNRVKNLVLATKHIDSPRSIDEKIIVDVDLARLGCSLKEFKEYSKAIREEYGFVDIEEYKEGRKNILETFLKRDTIFNTDYFINKYEAKAQKNIKWAISQL